MTTKRALLSVTDKSGLTEFARFLARNGWEIVSTGGTQLHLEAEGVTVIPVEQVTGLPEGMGGRVKTLHHKILGGLLGRSDINEHVEYMLTHRIDRIGMAVVNLYDFAGAVASLPPDAVDQIIEKIDIGGPTVLRAAAKNFRDVIVVVQPADYRGVMDEMAAEGDLSTRSRFRLAEKVFDATAAYDALIAGFFKRTNL